MSNINSFMSMLIFSFFPIGTLQAQIDSWQQMDFPQQYGGTIWALHVSPNGTIYAGTSEDGLVRSTNNGETWKQVLQFNGPPLIASTSTNTLFCSTGDGGELYRSSDNGESWYPIGPSGTFVSIRGLAVSNLNQIFIGDASAGVYRSSDNGDTWELVNNGLPITVTPSRIVISHVGSKETLFLVVQDYVSNQSILYRSTNNGDLWTSLIIPTSYIDNLFVHSNGFIFFKGTDGVMRSIDNGDSWQLVWAYEFNAQDMISLSNGDIWSGYNYGFPAWGTPFFRSTDNGLSWNGFDTVGTGSIYAFARSQDGSIFMGTEHTGLFKTTDNGLTWFQTNTGFPNSTTQVTAISGISNGFMSAGTTQFGSFISTNSGVNWIRNYPGHYDNISGIVIHPAGKIFTGCNDPYYAYLQYSTDYGNHWQGTTNSIMAYDIAIDDKGNIYSSGLSGVQRSTDIGTTWNSLQCPGAGYTRMHVARHGTIVVLTLDVIPSHYGNIIYYITRTSTDGGITWTQSSPGNSSTQVYEYTSTNNGYLFAATQLGVYRSNDSGQTWYPANNGITAYEIHSLVSNSLDVIFAGSNTTGVFRSTNYGYSWESFNTGLTDTNITSLYCDSLGYLFAGTYNNGIFKTTKITTSVNSMTYQKPVKYSLSQNYPNPFNPNTTINFIIPFHGFITLKIFDLLGREVATLVNEEMIPGSYERVFNASGLSSGIYLYRLQAGSFVQTKKLLLLR
jgi:photosystem II stability/assembly factor-like uncharacterized protein